jgi:exopolysaccharide production protein ExoY
MTRGKLSRPAPAAITTHAAWANALPAVGAQGSLISQPAVEIRTSRIYEAAKRIFDVVVCLLLLAPLVPVFVLLALAIKLGDGGPVFYRREVVGRFGQHFFALKFRTMIPHADEYLAAHPDVLARYSSQVKLRDDPRVTRIGGALRRTSLDELPQIFNVLRGQMSLVGPRIIHPSELERFGAFAPIRQLVRPSITGLWQVSGRQQVSYTRRVELDVEYLLRRSFWFDLRILGKTVIVVLRRQGAY